MPSERSIASEITGENAARQNARSISLQAWLRPFWITTRVMGSMLMLMVPDVPPSYPGRRFIASHRHQQIAQCVQLHAVARIDHRGAVELLDDGRAGESRVQRQFFPLVDGRIAKAAFEPDLAHAVQCAVQIRGALAKCEHGHINT